MDSNENLAFNHKYYRESTNKLAKRVVTDFVKNILNIDKQSHCH